MMRKILDREPTIPDVLWLMLDEDGSNLQFEFKYYVEINQNVLQNW